MAIKKDTTTVHGFTVPGAYHRVDNVTIVGKNKIMFHVYKYVDASKPFFAEQAFESEFDLLGENPIAQAYAHLKTLPEFVDAVDC